MFHKPLQRKIRTSWQSQSHQYSISIQLGTGTVAVADQIRGAGGGGWGGGNDDQSDPEISGSGRLDFRRLPGPVFDPPRRESSFGGWVWAHFPEQVIVMVIEPTGVVTKRKNFFRPFGSQFDLKISSGSHEKFSFVLLQRTNYIYSPWKK